MKQSILQRKKECYFCRALWEAGKELPTEYTSPLHRHHIMHGTANRRIADRYGLWVWLCPYHHTMAPEAVHRSRFTDLRLIRIGQQAFEQKHSHMEWMELFRKNYL